MSNLAAGQAVRQVSGDNDRVNTLARCQDALRLAQSSSRVVSITSFSSA
jgi:hypothetical protein